MEFYGRFVKPTDLATKYAGKDTLPESHDVAEIIARAPYGFTWAGTQAHPVSILESDIYPFLEAQRQSIFSGKVPSDWKLFNGDFMNPESFAFCFLTDLAVLPRFRYFGAGATPVQVAGALTVEEWIARNLASGQARTV